MHLLIFLPSGSYLSKMIHGDVVCSRMAVDTPKIRMASVENRAVFCENQYLKFQIRSDETWAVQPKNKAKGLRVWIKKID